MSPTKQMLFIFISSFVEFYYFFFQKKFLKILIFLKESQIYYILNFSLNFLVISLVNSYLIFRYYHACVRKTVIERLIFSYAEYTVTTFL